MDAAAHSMNVMKGNCAPCHALRELPPEVVGVQGKDSEANN